MIQGHIIGLHRMHELQTISFVTDVSGVCPSVCLSHGSTRLHCAGSFGAAFAKSLWPLVIKSCSILVVVD